MTIKLLIPYALRQRVKALPGMLALQFQTLHRSSLSQLASGRTVLCLESFPRSGNGFAYTIIRDVLGLPYSEIAHHTHSTANLRRAVDRGLPAYVIVREPHECCASLVVWGACRSLNDALAAYEAFHRDLLPLLDKLTIVRFEDLTAAPAGFVHHVANALNIEPPIWTEDTATTVSDTIEQSDVERRVARFVRTSLPTEEKEQRKREVAERSRSPQIEVRLARCRALRDAVLARAAPL